MERSIRQAECAPPQLGLGPSRHGTQHTASRMRTAQKNGTRTMPGAKTKVAKAYCFAAKHGAGLEARTPTACASPESRYRARPGIKPPVAINPHRPPGTDRPTCGRATYDNRMRGSTNGAGSGQTTNAECLDAISFGDEIGNPKGRRVTPSDIPSKPFGDSTECRANPTGWRRWSTGQALTN